MISLKTRTLPVETAIDPSLSALNWLQAQGCQQIVFKYCSTFDSTPERQHRSGCGSPCKCTGC
ncbi:four-carbon acid sugar kinase family protein [uncultured Cohaesibacter sp.]|uniref:four-carbon acid sugar kinase family protein n=1 Tax=uncultured Cohaesibacter sp. TaxID=1002546 RepID=UPI00374A2340